MRILLVNLPWRGAKYAVRAGGRWAHTFDKEEIVSFRPFPFFMGCSATLLEKSGHKVEVIDALAEKINEKKFFNKVKRFNPDYIVAETATTSYENDKIFAKELKQLTGAKIVFCGQHATALPEDVAKENNAVDYVLVGEYEFLLKELIESKSKGKIRRITSAPDINKIPWPARQLFKIELYNEAFCREYPNVQLMTSRGCFYRCGYCNVHLMNAGHCHRVRKARDIVDEIKFVVDKYNPKEIYFDDDTINGTPKALEAWLDLKIKEGVDIPFTAMAHVVISASMLEKMRKAGCVGMKFGIESADNNVLKRLRKGITVEQAVKTINLCKKLGIRTHLTYAIGLPGDTEQTIKKTIQFAQQYGDHYQISIASPFPGTYFFEEAMRNGWLKFKSWNDFNGLSESIVSYPHLSNKKIAKLYRWGQYSGYIKIIQSGEWRKYIKMIYKEHGLNGVARLLFVRGPGIVKNILISRA